MRVLEYREAVAEALVQAMEKDENVFIMGQGVGDSTGIFGTTLEANKKFPERVLDMPLSEALITGAGTGAAIAGLRPVMVHARNDFLYLAMDQICNHAAIWSYMHGGGIKIPWVIRAIVGRGWGNAAQHSQSLQALFAHIPGLKVVMPATPSRAKGLLIAGIEDDGPVMFLEHRSLYHNTGNVPEGYFSLPLGRAQVLKEGSDISFIAVSHMVVEALKAARILEECGVSAEVVDVSSLKPLDKGTILASVSKTRRAIVLDTAWRSFGASAEISAMINEDLFFGLAAPVIRIALPDSPIPCSPVLEKDYYPGVRKIIDETLRICDCSSCVSDEELETEEMNFQGPF